MATQTRPEGDGDGNRGRGRERGRGRDKRTERDGLTDRVSRAVGQQKRCMDAKHFIKLKAEQGSAEREGRGGKGIGCEAAKLVIRNRIENMGEISGRKVLAGEEPTTPTMTADCVCKSRTSFILYTHTQYICVCVYVCLHLSSTQ